MKIKDYSNKYHKIARITKLLSHPARIMLLDLLMNKGYIKSEDMSKGYPIAFTSVSQHLKELREIGLVYKKFDNNGIAYYLNIERFNELKKLIVDYFHPEKRN